MKSKSPYTVQELGGKWPASAAALPEPETLPDGTVRYFLVLEADGSVRLPADMSAALGLEAGDVITAWVKDGEARVHGLLLGLRKVQAEATSLAAANVYASEELIAQRRAEAAKDDEELLLDLRESRKGKKQ